jgi:hypothetical protein
MRLRWQGEGVEEEGIDVKTGKVVVKVDTRYFRPAEVEYVIFLLYHYVRLLMLLCSQATSWQPREGRARTRLAPQG